VRASEAAGGILSGSEGASEAPRECFLRYLRSGNSHLNLKPTTHHPEGRFARGTCSAAASREPLGKSDSP
jgi:hypothetical protein